MGFCKWHEKELKDVHEHDKEKCFDNDCTACVYLAEEQDGEE